MLPVHLRSGILPVFLHKVNNRHNLHVQQVTEAQQTLCDFIEGVQHNSLHIRALRPDHNLTVFL
ncbi:hypothetical protein D3C74_391570 [compost metagenome]